MRRYVPVLMALVYLALSAKSMKHLDMSDGLSDLLVNKIYKDSRGYVWFGNEVGLDRFDGAHVLSFPFPSGDGSKRVTSIIDDDEGNVYAGNSQGVYILRHGNGTFENFRPDLIKQGVTSLAKGDDGTIYAGTAVGVWSWSDPDKELQHHLIVPDITSTANDITGMVWDTENGMWICGKQSLALLAADGSIKTYPIPNGVWLGSPIADNGKLHFPTRGQGVYTFDIQTGEFTGLLTVGNGIVTALSLDPDDCIVVATDGEGLFKCNREMTEVIDSCSAREKNTPIRSNSIYSMLIDGNNVPWIGYYQSGVDYLPATERTIHQYDILPTGNSDPVAVRSIAVNGAEKVVGTRQGLYYINEKTGVHKHYRTPQINSNLIFAIHHSGNRYYIGTYGGGAWVLDPRDGSISRFDKDGVLGSDASVWQFVDDGDLTWLASSQGIVAYRNGRFVRAYTSENSQLPEGNVYCLFEDSSGRRWVSTDNGVALWDGGRIRTDRFPEGFLGRTRVRSIFETADHQLLFLLDRGGIFRSNLALTDFGYYSGKLSYDGEVIQSISQDSKGYIWISGNTGLRRWNPTTDEYRIYTTAHGLPNMIFTGCKPVMEDNGRLWLGNSGGLVYVDTRSDSLDIEPRPLLITDLYTGNNNVFNRLVSDGNHHVIELNGNESDLKIHLSDMSYADPSEIAAEMMVEGRDSTWRPFSIAAGVHLYDLDKGVQRVYFRPAGETTAITVIDIHRKMGYWYAVVIALTILSVVAIYIYMRRKRATAKSSSADQISESKEEPVEETVKQASYKTTAIPAAECERILHCLDEIMTTQRPYTNPDLKISDLADLAHTSRHVLSYIFNQHLDRNYYDYVNTYRVDEFKRMVKTVDISRYTMTAISQMCGFSSRASFFRHFKTITGMTPAEYIKTLDK